MVLSNKKLKQKLRAVISESLAKTSISNPSNPEETTKSVKQLLGSLSKREKRRKTMNLRNPDVENGENGENEGTHLEKVENGEKKEKKKRKREKREKRDENNGGVDEEDDGLDKKRKGKKKTKKKNNKSKNGKMGKQSEVENDGVLEQSVGQSVDYNNSQGNNEDKKKVYVGGIPFYSTEDDVHSFFIHCGTITDVDCMTFPESGKFRGIAIISFKTEEAAKRALALDGADMGGLYLIVKPYKATKTTTSDFSPPVLAGYNRIYAGNLSWEITEDDLQNLFSNCKISAIRFGEDKETGEFKGYAHVDFADDASLTKALKLDQTLVCGRPVRIRCAVPPKKGAITKSVSVSTVVKADAVAVNNNEGEASNSGVARSKIKRRTCYECGERGHISSACPKKKSNEENNRNSG